MTDTAPELKEDGYFHFPQTGLLVTEEWLDNYLVMYPVPYRYNGGIVIDRKWGKGVKVPPPEVPEGYKLVDLGVGIQFGYTPPRTTKYLKPI